MRIFANASYDFLGQRRKAYVVSAIVLAIGFVAMLFFALARGSWVNYGVDFTGGTLVQVRFEQAMTVGELRPVAQSVVAGSEVTRFGEESEFLIRAPAFSEEGTNISDRLLAALEAEFGAGAFELARTEAVGPRIGAELQQRALLAILLSFAFTLIYLAFRFEWRFGVAAVIATLHDILLTLGFIAVFRLEVSVTTVAAVLTIIGYSLNDTIIVFDRIRENLRATGRREDSRAIINRSINETLPRTVMTSGTTLAVLLALFILGGDTLREFALILILGIVIGTYSSVFVASPMLLEIERRWGAAGTERKKKPARPAASAGV